MAEAAESGRNRSSTVCSEMMKRERRTLPRMQSKWRGATLAYLGMHQDQLQGRTVGERRESKIWMKHSIQTGANNKVRTVISFTG